MDLNINAEEHFRNLATLKQNGKNGHKTEDDGDSVLFITDDHYDYAQFGFKLDYVYDLARRFIKEKDKEGITLKISYNDRNLLYVLAKQAYHGYYREDVQKQIGFLDLVGKDRASLWKSISHITKDNAMKEYITLLVKICPPFHSSLEEHKRQLDDEKLKRQSEEKAQLAKMSQQREHKISEDELRYQEETRKKREDTHRKQIQEALNQQTYPHFKAYAEQQHPNNSMAQQELIRQLQEQHFEQYMNQVYQQQLLHQQQQAEQLKALRIAQKTQTANTNTDASIQSVQSTNIQTEPSNKISNETTFSSSESQSVIHENSNTNSLNDNDQDNNLNDDTELPPISAASMFTRRDIKEFRDLVRKDNDAIIKVGSGETVTVRVPTHEDGRLLFWEFATDFYDIGFGLYFEWTIAPSSNVTVHVSDSSEEDEIDEASSDKPGNDVEKGKGKSNLNKPPCDEIIPIFRRDSHTEVHAGSHLYPGRGVYLLKFDNSYSLWRSKTLYYRVYYSK